MTHSNIITIGRAEYDALVEDRRTLDAVQSNGECLVLYAPSTGGVRKRWACSRSDAVALLGAPVHAELEYWRQRVQVPQALAELAEAEATAPAAQAPAALWGFLVGSTLTALVFWGVML